MKCRISEFKLPLLAMLAAFSPSIVCAQEGGGGSMYGTPNYSTGAVLGTERASFALPISGGSVSVEYNYSNETLVGSQLESSREVMAGFDPSALGFSGVAPLGQSSSIEWTVAEAPRNTITGERTVKFDVTVKNASNNVIWSSMDGGQTALTLGAGPDVVYSGYGDANNGTHSIDSALAGSGGAMSIEWDLGSYDAQANSLSGAYSDVNGADIDFTVDFASTEYDYRVEMNDSGGGQAWLFAYEDGSSIYAGPLE